VPGPEGVFDCVATDQSCDDYVAPAVLGDAFCVTARQPGGDGRWQLWCSDGTAAGTRMLEDGVGPHIVASEGQLYFTRALDDRGSQLWRRGAADAASTPVAVLPGYIFTYTSQLTGLPGGIAFDLVPADESWWSGEPWWSDGTAAGTTLLRDIRGDDAGAAPRDFVSLGEIALFSADDGTHGRELWRSDASPDGTRLVADIAAGPTGSDPQRPVRLGDFAVFVADDGVHGRELWRSDGTAAGTALVADLNPGAPAADLDLSRPPARSCTSSPTTAPTAASSGAAMVRRRAPLCWPTSIRSR
jgi:ELWxxDGT repeat protein